MSFHTCTAASPLLPGRVAEQRQATEAVIIERVRSAIHRRRAAIDKIYVRYRERLEPSTEAKQQKLLAGIVTDIEVAVAFAGEKRYCMSKRGQEITIATYNGYVCKIWHERTKLGNVQRPKSHRVEANSYFPSIFWPMSDYDKSLVKRGIITYSLEDILEQPGWRVISSPSGDTGSALVLQRSQQEKMWFDPSRGYVLTRRIYRERPLSRRDMVSEYQALEFTEVKPGCWLPTKIRTISTAADDPRCFYTRSIEVQEITADFDDALFDSLRFPPGSDVVDAIAGVSYTVPAQGIDQFAKSINLAKQQMSSPRGTLVDWLIPLNVSVGGLLLVGYAVQLIKRLRRRLSDDKMLGR